MVPKLEITEENARLTMDHLYLDNHQIKTTSFTYFLQLAETWMELFIYITLCSWGHVPHFLKQQFYTA